MDNLMNCEDCGKSVSRRALACPNCGSPIQEQSFNKENVEEKEPVKELAPVTLKKYVEPEHVETNLEKAFAWLPVALAVLVLITISPSITIASFVLAIAAVGLLIPTVKTEISEHILINKHIISAISVILIVASIGTSIPAPSPETVAKREAERERQKEAKTVSRDTSKAMLVTKCEFVIKPQLKNPKSMDVDFSTTKRYTTSTGFNLEMSYYAENSFGANMINKALCEFNKNGTLINVTSLE